MNHKHSEIHVEIPGSNNMVPSLSVDITGFCSSKVSFECSMVTQANGLKLNLTIGANQKDQEPESLGEKDMLFPEDEPTDLPFERMCQFPSECVPACSAFLSRDCVDLTELVEELDEVVVF